MSLTFRDVLVGAGIDPATVMLAKHHDTRHGKNRTPYALWRTDKPGFHLYQRIQREQIFKNAKSLAAFVVTPTKDTLFVGMYLVKGVSKCPPGTKSPLSGRDVYAAGAFFYDLEPTEELAEYRDRLSIDWGPGALTWVQYANRKPKPIVQLTKGFQERPFPGYLHLAFPLSDLPSLEPSWIDRLREAKGVYVLSCPKTRELYVGSATGDDGFYGRWSTHFKTGGDAVKLKSREPSDYQVAILEVAGTSASVPDILHSEYRWMDKLQTNDMGLNGGMLRDGKEKPVTTSASPASAARP